MDTRDVIRCVETDVKSQHTHTHIFSREALEEIGLGFVQLCCFKVTPISNETPLLL